MVNPLYQYFKVNNQILFISIQILPKCIRKLLICNNIITLAYSLLRQAMITILIYMDIIDQYAIDQSIKLRKRHQMTQKDFAKILNTTSAFIGNVENRKIVARYNLKHLRLLAVYFDISPQYFIMPNHTFV
jgi:DNA-binding XRE family transcriptional regulator